MIYLFLLIYVDDILVVPSQYNRAEIEVLKKKHLNIILM